MIELRCSRDLALRLGAFTPFTVAQHRELTSRSDFMLVRDRETGWAMFWAIVPLEVPVSTVVRRLLGKSS